MPAVFDHHYRVAADDIDGLGHASNVAFIEWMQSAAIAHSAIQGWPIERLVELGAGWVVKRHAIDYHSPAFLHDDIVVKTWVAGFGRISSVRKYQIIRRKNDTMLASAETTWVFVGIKNIVPRRIPEEVIRSFQIVSVADEPRVSNR